MTEQILMVNLEDYRGKYRDKTTFLIPYGPPQTTMRITTGSGTVTDIKLNEVYGNIITLTPEAYDKIIGS